VQDSTSVWRTIVGVVGNERQRGLALPPRTEIFEPFAQVPSGFQVMVLRTSGDPAALGPSLRAIVANLDPNLAISSLRTMDDVRAISLAMQRFITVLLVSFAAVGLLLALVGVYGVLAQLARGRTREMGIRIALGAQGSDVRWLVLRHGMTLTLVGVVVGGGAAWLATRLMTKLLFQVAPGDPLTFSTVALLLGITGAAASWIPALRASRADPAMTLRSD
jgi:ABC-type antimicrobial peptide transport system permease subunit